MYSKIDIKNVIDKALLSQDSGWALTSIAMMMYNQLEVKNG